MTGDFCTSVVSGGGPREAIGQPDSGTTIRSTGALKRFCCLSVARSRSFGIDADCPTAAEDSGQKSENKYSVLARPPISVAGVMHPRSTYRGERQLEGQSKKSAAYGAYTGGGVAGVPVLSPRPKHSETLVLKPGPGIATKRKPQPKTRQAEARTYQLPGGSKGPVKVEHGSKVDPVWKAVPPRAVTTGPEESQNHQDRRPKPKAPSRKRWAS